MAAGCGAGLHAVQVVAAAGAFLADLGAFAADMAVVAGAGQHEMGRGAADFRAGHHQAEMFGRDMAAAAFQAMAHGGTQAGLIAGETGIDAALHLRGDPGHRGAPLQVAV